MVSSITECTILANGVQMPWFGLGVFRMEEGAEVERAVRAALDVGYRSIDTAAFYRNEKSVGKAIRDSGVPREDIFVATKVWNTDQGYDKTLKAFDESRKELQFDYVDLYLIHWPVPAKGLYKETWRALEKLYEAGLVRAIGVSNFKPHHLEDVLADCEVKPMLNQIELHPLLTQEETRRYCAEHQIQVEAWSPLMAGQALTHPTIVEVSKKYERTPAQIMIRWDLQHGIVTIPKSSKPQRILENSQVFDFEISDEDMALIDGLDENKRVGPDPDVHN
jgi:diketogulonate reductase-like aldo/keto reductase